MGSVLKETIAVSATISISVETGTSENGAVFEHTVVDAVHTATYRPFPRRREREEVRALCIYAHSR